MIQTCVKPAAFAFRRCVVELRRLLRAFISSERERDEGIADST
jgi:hypothetical protein